MLVMADKQNNLRLARQIYCRVWEIHRVIPKLFKQAQDMAKSKKDMDLKVVFICPVCGDPVLDEVLDEVPEMSRLWY